MRILLVEDHQDIAKNFGQFFEAKGDVVDYALDGITGLHLAVVNHYDIIVLDLGLPGMDGLAICNKLRREAQMSTPILILSARDLEEDKIAGFNAGSDDYVVKPYSLRELDARIIALYRRSKQTHHIEQTLKVADLEYNLNTITVSRAGQTVALNPACRKILRCLMEASPGVVSRRELEFALWGDEPPDGDFLRTHIYTLRTIIDKPYACKLIHTIHGTGYRLAPLNRKSKL